MLIILAASALVYGVAIPAQVQSAMSKDTAKSSASKPAAAAATAAAGGAEPTLIGQFGTWGAYTAAPNGKKLCFALAKPSSSIGYALKPGSESTLQVGGATYAMYTQGDGLWIKNAAEEERMVEAMRKAADVVVKGVSAKGTETTDTFSMKGLSQALDRLAQDCRR